MKILAKKTKEVEKEDKKKTKEARRAVKKARRTTKLALLKTKEAQAKAIVLAFRNPGMLEKGSATALISLTSSDSFSQLYLTQDASFAGLAILKLQ